MKLGYFNLRFFEVVVVVFFFVAVVSVFVAFAAAAAVVVVLAFSVTFLSKQKKCKIIYQKLTVISFYCY